MTRVRDDFWDARELGPALLALRPLSEDANRIIKGTIRTVARARPIQRGVDTLIALLDLTRDTFPDSAPGGQ
ncbi:MAG: hypothetical protein H6Q86_70 [candidate division NC10 bacterium]|nr:hypothetical protein [candidate division NC10 bacterium]